MNTTRTYAMGTRRAAAEATRQRILDAATEAFLTDWFDEVTIQSIAAAAGVSGQTVINHYGGKDALLAAVGDRIGEQVVSTRGGAAPGDVDAVIAALVEDYEVTGDAIIRALALEEKMESIKPLLARGRAGHRNWVEETFARPGLTAELIAATDVYTWKLFRRDQNLSREATCAAMIRMVRALLALGPEYEETSR